MLTGCETTGSGETSVSTSTAAAPLAPGEQKAWMMVSSGRITPAVGEAPENAYIEGVQLADGTFRPASHVQGEYKCLCGIEKYMHTYTTGWRDVSTGKFIAKTAENSPQRPYVLGQINEEGKFTPDSRAVAF